MLGGEAVGMTYYAANAIDANTTNYKIFNHTRAEKKAGGAEKIWDETPFSFDKAFPVFLFGERGLCGRNMGQQQSDFISVAFLAHIWSVRQTYNTL